MNQIRDQRDVERLAKNIDLPVLRQYLDGLLREGLNGREESEVPAEELARIFAQADQKISARFGVSVWDAMVLLNETAGGLSVEKSGFDDWRTIYDWIFDAADAQGIRVSMQEDYDGVQELTLLCSSDDFEEVVKVLSRGHPVVRQGFRIVLRGIRGNDVIQEHAYQFEPAR
jgi:hypothetical protein